jgi:acetyltransferase-like isoleucine patch superfamily enzyme
VIFKNVLNSLNINSDIYDADELSEIFFECTLNDVVNEFSFDDSLIGLKVPKVGFGSNCRMFLTKKGQANLSSGKASINILRMGVKECVDDVNILVNDFAGKIQIIIGSAGNVIIGNCGALNIDIRLGHKGGLFLGDGTTANGVRFIAVNNNIKVGKDCMFSDEVLVQGFDQHGIFDIQSRDFINLRKRGVLIDDHVWIGRRTTLISGVEVGSGSIVGACAVVTKNVPSCVAVAGNPARVVREKVSWSRSWIDIDPETQCFLDLIDANREI